jgi:hypothetical protein
LKANLTAHTGDDNNNLLEEEKTVTGLMGNETDCHNLKGAENVPHNRGKAMTLEGFKKMQPATF